MDAITYTNLSVLVTNWRVAGVSTDVGSLRWLVRRARAVRLARRHNPDVILAQEIDETMLPYVEKKLGMLSVKPTAGNRPILYRPEWGLLQDTKWTDVGGRSFVHAARIMANETGVEAWFVTVHLSTSASERLDQIPRLKNFLSQLEKDDIPIVIGGDFNQELSTSFKWGYRHARNESPFVTNRQANSIHGWRDQKWEGVWKDHLLVWGKGVSVRWCDLILTSVEDESDHNWLGVGVALFAPDPVIEPDTR